MGKERCFCIEGKELYLEQVLVDYNSIPIFFLCKENKIYYLALCTDIEEMYYMIVRLSEADVYDLLHGKLSMREAFTRQINYWEVISGEEIDSDIVTQKMIEEIDYSVLPEEGACFEVLTEEMASYVKTFDAAFLANGEFQLIQELVEINEDIPMLSFGRNNERIEQFVELCDCLLIPKEAVGLQSGNIGYAEDMHSISCLRIGILENASSEEWRAAEMNDLAFAA